MKKGICYGCIRAEGGVAQRLAATRAAGFDGVELSFAARGDGPLTMDLGEAEIDALRDLVASHGLQATSLMCGALLREAPLVSADAAVRAQGLANLRRGLRVAARLGADTILVHPGQLRPEARYDAAFGWLVAALRELRPDLEATGVGLAIENVWNKFLLSPLEMRELIDQVGHPLVGAYFDVGNVVAFGYPQQWVHILGPRVRRVHVKDFRGRPAQLTGFCQLMDGDVDWPAVVAALRAIGYDGYLTSEVGGVGLKETAERIDRIIALADAPA